MKLTVTIDDRALREALAKAPEEIARATRNAFNDIGREAQREFRATLPGKFLGLGKGRSHFDRLVHLQLATTGALEVELAIRGPNDYLLRQFEDQGEKRPFRGSHLAFPGRAILTGRGGQVKPGTKLTSFLPLHTLAGSYTKLRRRKGRLVAGRQVTLHQPRVVGQRGAFLITTAGGHPALVRRQGRASRSLELLYLFVPRTHLPRNLMFVADVLRAIERSWEGHVTAAVQHGLRRAGLTVSA